MKNPFGESVDSKQSSPEAEEIFGVEGQDDLEKQQADPDKDGQSSTPEVQTDSDLILGKFKGVEPLAEAYVNIMEQKLEKEPEQFDTVEQLIEAYKEAERELGRRGSKEGTQTSDVDNLQKSQQKEAELAQLKQLAQQQQQQLQQMAQYYQMLQAQALRSQQQQPGFQGSIQQQQQIQEQIAKIEPEEFLDQFYKNPAEMIQKLVEPLVEQRAKNIQQQYQNMLQQQIAPTQQYVALKRLEDTYERQINELRSSIPDFNEYEKDILPEINKDPALQQLLGQNPSAVQVVVKTAYDRAKINRLQQQNAQTQNELQKQQNINQKKSAGITVSSSAAKRVLRQPSAEEKELAEIFGLNKKTKGIFG